MVFWKVTLPVKIRPHSRVQGVGALHDGQIFE